jgi:hypothetical protein
MGDHLIVMHSAVRVCPGYDRHEAPSIYMDGASVAQDTEHGKAVTAQLTRRQDTLDAAIDAGIFALGAAGLPRGIRRQARAACEDYFYERLGLAADRPLGGRIPAPPSLEPMAEDMRKALEQLVEYVVDGDYEELRELSGDRLDVEDLRRRVEDDVPEALVLPPEAIYRVEAITVSEDPEVPGWSFFLDLWTETGPARLHLVGYLDESAGRYGATLVDIAP